ncbi:hypothetical protein J2046_003744 [Rhizobium petrolearium]|uniref:hypothetical protein n=1 Tax=Neorhizobium petrolearium TaxID=515361 RepID=UPI001AE8BBB8|nr:hypothetical protein [Neorhizobium petrolearium]MBP1845471.1 hypothetical protein [Neorhizobium petrolearium]
MRVFLVVASIILSSLPAATAADSLGFLTTGNLVKHQDVFGTPAPLFRMVEVNKDLTLVVQPDGTIDLRLFACSADGCFVTRCSHPDCKEKTKAGFRRMEYLIPGDGILKGKRDWLIIEDEMADDAGRLSMMVAEKGYAREMSAPYANDPRLLPALKDEPDVMAARAGNVFIFDDQRVARRAMGVLFDKEIYGPDKLYRIELAGNRMSDLKSEYDAATSSTGSPASADAESIVAAGIDLDGILTGRIQSHISAPIDHPDEFALGFDVLDHMLRSCWKDTEKLSANRDKMWTVIIQYYNIYYPPGRISVPDGMTYGKFILDHAAWSLQQLSKVTAARSRYKQEPGKIADAILAKYGGCGSDEAFHLVQNLLDFVMMGTMETSSDYTDAPLIETYKSLDNNGLFCVYDDDPADFSAREQRYYVSTPLMIQLYTSQLGLKNLPPRGEKVPMIRAGCPAVPDPNFDLIEVSRKPVLDAPHVTGDTRIERVADYFASVYAPALLKDRPDLAYDDEMMAMIRRFIVDWEGINVTQAERDAVRQAEINELKAGGHDSKIFISGDASHPGDRFDDRARWRKYEDLYGPALPKEELRTQRDKTFSMLISNYQMNRSSFASIK